MDLTTISLSTLYHRKNGKIQIAEELLAPRATGAVVEGILQSALEMYLLWGETLL